jgi:hypothetical protein
MSGLLGDPTFNFSDLGQSLAQKKAGRRRALGFDQSAADDAPDVHFFVDAERRRTERGGSENGY